MNRDRRASMSRGSEVRRFRFAGIVFFLLLLIALSALAELVVLRYQQATWDSRAGERTREYVRSAERAFVGVQRATRRLATEIAHHRYVLEVLEGGMPAGEELFTYLQRISRVHDVGIEIFDRSARLVAWEGRGDTGERHEVQIALDGQLTSSVSPGPVYSYLFIATPVRSGSRIIGAVLIRRTIEVHYPLNSRFINREGLSVGLTRELGVPVEFEFNPGSKPVSSERSVSAILEGIDRTRVGVVRVLLPSQAAARDAMSQRFRGFQSVLIILLLGFLSVAGIRRALAFGSLLLRSLTVSAILWGVRYALLWTGIPSSILTTGIFDPSYFASTFGGGLARSIGEMTLTSLTLLLTTSLILRMVMERARAGPPWWHPPSAVLRWLIAFPVVVLIFLLLRGYGATVRSAVFDSTLGYTDPGVIIPSFQLAMMVLNLFMISFCLIVAAVGLFSFLLSLLSPDPRGSLRHRLVWAGGALLLLLAAVLFGLLQPQPLMSTPYRMLFGAGIFAFTASLHTLVGRRQPMATLRNLVLAFGLSAVLFYPLLLDNVKEKDRRRLEAFAGQVLRPVDTWLAFVVDDALNGLTGEASRTVLESGRQEEIAKLAFLRWAGSLASSEGYNCRFALVDTAGAPLSEFWLGSKSLPVSTTPPARPAGEGKSIHVREAGSGLDAVRLYEGTAPVRATDGTVIAHAVAVVAAGQQSLYRGDNPAILRTLGRETVESFKRDVSLTEYRDGALLRSTNPRVPLNHRIPDRVAGTLADSNVTSLWYEESFEGRPYETLFVRRAEEPGRVMALGLEDISIAWHLFNVVKVMLYYALVVVLLLASFLVLRSLRGVPYRFTFRDRLLAAFLFTSVVPLVVLAVWGRSMARERLEESTAALLEQETAAVTAALGRPAVQNEPRQGFFSRRAEQVANELGTDFNLYEGTMLRLSSRPELYDAGILDPRISGSAWAAIVGRGKRFHLETERVGLYQYAVGYAPLLDSAGVPSVIVSVPTLYRQEEIDREVSQQNALLFGLYAVILLGVVFVATTVATRIAAPIHQLTAATRRVSGGELDISVNVQATEGEIGELIRSFEKMTRDLKRSRAELIQYERELAWKEMARQVAHEIRNPLTPMKLSLQHLRQTYADRAPDFNRIFEEVSRTIIEQIDTLSRIASEFSQFARMPGAQREACDVNEVLREAVQLFAQHRGMEFRIASADGLPSVSADREELRRAFINILRNGIEAMGDTGVIAIETQPSESGVRIRITDRGVGMSEEVRANLFRPNFSTKTDGMGLGLAIVKKTVDDLRGTISVESVPGEGTTVVLELPSASGAGSVG